MTDKLTAEFVTELLYCSIQNRDALEICLAHIKENYLPLDEQKEVFRELQKQKNLGYKKISFGTLMQEFRKNELVFDYLRLLKEMDVETDMVLSKYESFLKQSKFIELYDQCYDIYNKGKKSEAYQHLITGADELSKFNLSVDRLTTVLGEFHSRNAERIIKNSNAETGKIPFGIDELDDITNGGPEAGDLVMGMGDAKSGKSIFLIHCGVNAMRRGHGVLHVQGEGTKEQLMRRYDSAWSGSTYYEIKDGNVSDDKFKVYKKIVDNLGRTDIHVLCSEKYSSLNMVEIRRVLIDLKKQHEIKAVVIDYADLIDPDSQVYKVSDERFRQQRTVRAMKDLAVEQSVIVYTATQASSIAKELLDDPTFVINHEHLAEDKGKVRPVDMLFSFNRTADERKSKIARIFVDVLREHDSGQIVTIAQSLGRTRFYDRKRTLELDLGDMND